MTPSYDIEADWILLQTCNFRCSYCFFRPEQLGEKIRRYGTPADWAAGFDRSDRTWLLHITGGEPSIYPGFPELCERLSARHYLSINSNLFNRSIDEVAARVDPARVLYVNAALHPLERLRRGAMDGFVGRARRLAANGFRVLVSVTMEPPAVAHLDEIAEYLGRGGLFPIPKILRTTYGGRRYPASYSEEERATIRRYLGEARTRYGATIDAVADELTINMLADDRFLGGLRSYRGTLCGSGHNFVRIEPDGSLLRCGSGQRLGNVLAGDFRLLPGPRPCDSSYCPYFCEKYTSPPFVAPAIDRESRQALPWG